MIDLWYSRQEFSSTLFTCLNEFIILRQLWHINSTCQRNVARNYKILKATVFYIYDAFLFQQFIELILWSTPKIQKTSPAVTFNTPHSPFLLAAQQVQEDQAFLCPPAR